MKLLTLIFFAGTSLSLFAQDYLPYFKTSCENLPEGPYASREHQSNTKEVRFNTQDQVEAIRHSKTFVALSPYGRLLFSSDLELIKCDETTDGYQWNHFLFSDEDQIHIKWKSRNVKAPEDEFFYLEVLTAKANFKFDRNLNTFLTASEIANLRAGQIIELDFEVGLAVDSFDQHHRFNRFDLLMIYGSFKQSYNRLLNVRLSIKMIGSQYKIVNQSIVGIIK